MLDSDGRARGCIAGPSQGRRLGRRRPIPSRPARSDGGWRAPRAARGRAGRSCSRSPWATLRWAAQGYGGSATVPAGSPAGGSGRSADHLMATPTSHPSDRVLLRYSAPVHLEKGLGRSQSCGHGVRGALGLALRGVDLLLLLLKSRAGNFGEMRTYCFIAQSLEKFSHSPRGNVSGPDVLPRPPHRHAHSNKSLEGSDKTMCT